MCIQSVCLLFFVCHSKAGVGDELSSTSSTAMAAAPGHVNELYKMEETVRDLKDYLKSIHSMLASIEFKVDVLHNELQTTLQSVRSASPHEEPMYVTTFSHQQLNRGRIGEEAVRMLKDIVMNAVTSSASAGEPLVDDSLGFALQLTQPLTSEKVARAYSMVRSKKDNAKFVLRTMRDMLVLLVCCGETTRGPWNNERLKEEMNRAFKGPKEKADFDELMSQIVLTLNKIVESGKDKNMFNQRFEKETYGEVLGQRVADTIFAAYSIVAGDSPQYLSSAKLSGKAVRPGKRDRAECLNATGRPSIAPAGTDLGYVAKPHNIGEDDLDLDLDPMPRYIPFVDGIWSCSCTSTGLEAAGQASSSTQTLTGLSTLQ